MQKPVASDENLSYASRVLLTAGKNLEQNNQIHVDDLARDNVAVIVEPRKHPLLIPIIRTVMALLDDSWNLTVFHGTENAEYIRKGLPGWRFRMISMGVPNISADEHNKLLITTKFWEAIKEENLLIFQTDSCLLRRGVESFIGNNFIGAETLNPYELTPGGVGLNGGLSLRKRSAMLKTSKVPTEKISEWRKSVGKNDLPSIVYSGKIAEDVFHWHALEMLGMKLPDKQKARAFSTEAVYNRDSHGIHAAFNKTFFPFDDLRVMFETSDLIRL